MIPPNMVPKLIFPHTQLFALWAAQWSVLVIDIVKKYHVKVDIPLTTKGNWTFFASD